MHVYSIIQWDLVLYLCKMYSVLINFIECYFPPSHFFSALSFLSVCFFFSLFFLFLPHLETMCWIQTWCVNPLVVLSVEISRREVIKRKGHNLSDLQECYQTVWDVYAFASVQKERYMIILWKTLCLYIYIYVHTLYSLLVYTTASINYIVLNQYVK